jgi:hypothetical protein
MIYEQFPSCGELADYSRANLIAVFDLLHTYEPFKRLKSKDFPLRDAPLTSRRSNKIIVDPNSNPDFMVTDDFFGLDEADESEIDEPVISVSAAPQIVRKPNAIERVMREKGIAKLQVKQGLIVGTIGEEVVRVEQRQ